MNFLLHMLGQPHRSLVTLRPSGANRLRAQAAVALANGRIEEALAAFRPLVSETEGSITDTLTRGHLHLAAGEYSPAFTFFSTALSRIGEPPVSTLEQLIESADDHLRRSRFVRATELCQSARGMVDTLLSANAGLAVAAARMTNTTACSAGAILPLAKLGDLLLRMLARTHLASNLADSLRERHLRHDLAPWATSAGSIENLLTAEFEQLTEAAAAHPNHAELQYRLGLVARTLGKLPAAAKAFTRVLALHPHHVPSAARLVATHIQLRQVDAIFPLLAMAFAVPPNVLAQYAALAQAAQGVAFDQVAERMTALDGTETAEGRATVKANLAFALSELGLLDPTRAAWREMIPA
jgi:tetratricopeptide (TPR) repeat protein